MKQESLPKGELVATNATDVHSSLTIATARLYKYGNLTNGSIVVLILTAITTAEIAVDSVLFKIPNGYRPKNYYWDYSLVIQGITDGLIRLVRATDDGNFTLKENKIPSTKWISGVYVWVGRD